MVWFKQLEDFVCEKSIAHEILWNSRLKKLSETSILCVYQKELRSLLTPTIEKKVIYFIKQLGYEATEYKLLPDHVQNTPLQCRQQLRQQRFTQAKDRFLKTSVGQLLSSNPGRWLDRGWEIITQTSTHS